VIQSLLCFAIFPILFATQPIWAFAKLTPEAVAGFDRYVEQAEAAMDRDLKSERFLHMRGKADVKTKLRAGELSIEPGPLRSHAKEIEVPEAMIQDWMGIMFIPNATIQQVRGVLQDYQNYKNFYKPEVIESKQVAHQGDEFDVFLRLYKKQLITVVLNTNYRVRYGMLDPKHMYVTSRSTRIAEAKNSKGPYDEEEPIGDDGGYLWRLNSYWRFEEADGGVYAECEAISLSRDVPFALGWMIRNFVSKFPKESMLNTLRGTREAVEGRTKK
jgi:hypothetical protein